MMMYIWYNPVMKMTRTVVCKLAPTPEQIRDIDATLEAFAEACNLAAETARKIDSTNKRTVQKACYREIRQRFGLSANLAIRAIARACAALKIPQRIDSTFDPTSIDYDARIFRFSERDWTFGLTLLSGRVKLAAVIRAYQQTLLKGRKPTAAQLVRRRDGGYFLHVQLSHPAPEPAQAKDIIGVDMGVKNLATTDDGENVSGADVEKVRRKYQRIRRTCQRRGTKSAKRKLHKVRMRESRFRRDQNHIISKKLVAKAKGTNSAIAIEDLAGIGERTTARKADRSRLKGWAFYQLRQFVSYKAVAAGIEVIPVDPRDTSRTCPECGHCEKRNRKTRDDFECRKCGHAAPADVVGARNIRRKAIQHWADVGRPIVGVDDAGLETRSRPLASPRL
jgi:IS605 OrfB family transposase